MNMSRKRLASWILQSLVGAGFLFFGAMKFTSPAPLVEAFAEQGIPTMVIYGIGVAEVLAGVLLLIPATVIFGALLAIANMAGALLSHAAFLGFTGEVGSMWILAVVFLVLSGTILVLRSEQTLKTGCTLGCPVCKTLSKSMLNQKQTIT